MHSAAVAQVRCQCGPCPCGVYGHLPGDRDWKSWTHHAFKDGKELGRCMSPRLSSQEMFWIEKQGGN